MKSALLVAILSLCSVANAVSRSASCGGQYKQPASGGWFWLWRSAGVHRDGGFRWVRCL